MDLVSVIMPAYNAEKHIKAAVDSAINQTYQNIEVIVINDGSTDNTLNILRQYGNKIKIINQANKGRAAANNVGIYNAKGEWIAFLDADDIWIGNKTEKQLASCNNYNISHTDCIFFGEKVKKEIKRSEITKLYSGEVLDKLLVSNFITKSSVLIRKNLISEYGCFDESFECVIDWPLWLKVCANQKLGYLDEPLVKYRVHSESVSMASKKTLPVHIRILDDAFSPGGIGAAYPELRKSAYLSSYKTNSHYAAETGDWIFALSCCFKGLRYNATDSRLWKNIIKCLLIPLGIKY